ncbi:MAG: glycosyltransferase [Schwartzia sp.]|nr:glycosyltransferase [Schwartzia sp. (in: firmicutes)]
MPAISVIVPVYNGEEYLEACIDSILAQDFRDFEVIVVDDGSTDGTVALYEKLYGQNPLVRLHRHEKNQGLPIARNTGLSLATGKYVTFVDCDDLILWNMLSVMYETAERTGADVVSADGYLRANARNWQVLQSQDESLLERRAGSRMITEPTALPDDLRERLRMCIRYEMLVFAWNRLYSRKFLAENGLAFPDFRVPFEDILFYFVCLFYAKTYIRIPEFFYIYCQTPDSIVRSEKPPSWIGYLAKSMALGVRYLHSNLSRLPFFRENPDVKDSVIQLFLENAKYEHIAKGKFYAHYAASPEGDAAVRDALLPLFGEDASFVKYLFHVMNIHFAEASALLDENAALKAALAKIKGNTVD